MALSRIKTGVLTRLLNSSQVNKSLARTAFFNRRKAEEDDDGDADVELAIPTKRGYNENEISMRHNLNLLKAQKGLNTHRGYNPPDNVAERVEKVVKDVCNIKDGEWRDTLLNNPRQKYKVISKLIQELDHDMPGSYLNEMKTADDVCVYFQQPVKTTTALEDISKLDLPRNLSIQLEYLRFDPEEDTFFGGRTAFPGQNSIITSIKYKRKYKDTITKTPKAGYVDHYYGY